MGRPADLREHAIRHKLLESGLTVGEVARRRGVSYYAVYYQAVRWGWPRPRGKRAHSAPVERLLRRALVEDPRFTYAQVGRLLGGVSRQAIEKQAKKRGWRVAACRDGQRDAARTPAWERPSPADLRHVRELHALGMGAPEAMDLLGYGGRARYARAGRGGSGGRGRRAAEGLL